METITQPFVKKNDCPANGRHEFKQKLRGSGDYHIGHDGYYCIYCLMEVK